VRHGFGGGRCGGAAPAQGRPLAADRPYADRVSAPGGDRGGTAEKSGQLKVTSDPLSARRGLHCLAAN